MAWFDGIAAQREAGPGVVRGQVERHIVGRLALPQQVADALQVERDIGHHQPPRVVIVEHRRRVEAPSRLPGFGWRIRIAVRRSVG